MSEPDYVYAKGVVCEELVIIEDGRFTEEAVRYFTARRLAAIEVEKQQRKKREPPYENSDP